MSKIKISYQGMYDVPLMFVVPYEGHRILFDRPFDDNLDEYAEAYSVYLLPELPESTYEGAWKRLLSHTIKHLGEVPVKDVHFDPTRRKEIDSAVLDQMLSTTDRDSSIKTWPNKNETIAA